MAAKKIGKPFGAKNGVSRNKTDEEAQRKTRSGGQTNANSRVPSLREDVSKSTKADVGRVAKAIKPPPVKGAAKASIRSAGERAVSRLGARAGLAGGALITGYEAGRALDEKTGVGKKVVKAVLGEGKASGDRVELSSYTKDRQRSLARDKDTTPVKSPRASSKKTTSPQPSLRDGPNKNIEDDTRARAAAEIAKRYSKENLEDVNSHKWKGEM